MLYDTKIRTESVSKLKINISSYPPVSSEREKSKEASLVSAGHLKFCFVSARIDLRNSGLYFQIRRVRFFFTPQKFLPLLALHAHKVMCHSWNQEDSNSCCISSQSQWPTCCNHFSDFEQSTSKTALSRKKTEQGASYLNKAWRSG